MKNQFNTFAPYRVGFAPGSHRDFTVTPTAGTMNRRDSEPVNVLVRLLLVYSTNRPKASTHPIISDQQRARRQAALRVRIRIPTRQVRYNPKEYGEAKLAALIFETEDFKTVWNFIGSM